MKLSFFKHLSTLLALSLTTTSLVFTVSASGRSGPDYADKSPTSSFEILKSSEKSSNNEQLLAFHKYAINKQQENKDVVGWLHIPGTKINDVIVQRTDKQNDYYLKYNFYGQQDKDGSYCVDRRSSIGAGSRDSLSWNTILYGHSWDDNPNSKLFSQVKKYKDPTFAASHPYLFFSTTKENMVWEVFAVYNADIHLPYNRPDLNISQQQQLLETVKKASIYDYGITIKPNDKIITISTCTYSVPGYSSLPEINNFRFVVMARLVPAGTSLKSKANFTANPNPISPNFSNYSFS